MPDVQRPSAGHERDGSVLLVSSVRMWLASATAFLAADARSVATVETAAEALDHAMNRPPDVVVIAPPVGDSSPLVLIRQLAELRDRAALGIIYVTDRAREAAEHARLMRAGVNDWFPRGLPPAEAAKRIEALLSEILSPPDVRVVNRGPLVLDILARQALVGGVPIPLTLLEFRILEALALAAGRRMTCGELVAALRMRRGSHGARLIPKELDELRTRMGVAAGLLEISKRDGFRLRFVGPA